MSKPGNYPLTNAQIAELLALEAISAKMPAQKALRRASRRALFWEQEAAEIYRREQSLTQLTAVGPYIAGLISRWLSDPPLVPQTPEIRRGFLTLTEARATLAAKPSWLRNIKGDLQIHTTWSDGGGTIAEMAASAAERGYQYIAITDHSKGLKIAGGIDEKQLQQQAEEIGEVNDEIRSNGRRLVVLRSIELNLNPRGEGDMDDSCFPSLDLVLGCFHSALRTKEDQTSRYLAALRNPAIQILGHPRGRIYNYRVGLSADWQHVFDEAARLDKAIEIDGYPDRQDLSLELLRIAKKSGCRISFGTDSHGPSQLWFIEYCAAAALKAGIEPHRILNFMSVDELRAWASGVRDQRLCA